MKALEATSHTLTVTGPATHWLAASDPGEKHRFALVVLCRGEADIVPLRPRRPIVVGRRPPSEVVVDDVAVSRQHARFSVVDDAVLVEDLDSRNGTFLGGRRVDKRLLAPGQQIEVGPALFTVLASNRIGDSEPGSHLVIENPMMKRLFQQVDRLAERDVPVVIVGETGTGKEHIARALHERGPRRGGKFVALNCGAIPHNLTESILFGHERGAFTGATTQSRGVFEEADGGTLFFDEVGEMSEATQTTLLRALETGQITRVGGSRPIDVDVRVVAATHRDIDPQSGSGSFRPDLYYRLSTVVLAVPSLRERPEEIEPLTRRFLAEARRQWGVGPEDIETDALGALQRYDFPGNIRELRHIVQRAALLGQGRRVCMDDLPESVARSRLAEGKPTRTEHYAPLGDLQPLDGAMRQHERDVIARALEQTGGNRKAAAELLQVPHRTFYRKLKQHGL